MCDVCVMCVCMRVRARAHGGACVEMQVCAWMLS